jgi:hypothetical protein
MDGNKMNIFYFDDCPFTSAIAQPDKMLVKMTLETAQMLCTAHRVVGSEDYCNKHNLYKEAYKNHPCTIWARESSANYFWLYGHFLALGVEYKFRYGKEHASFVKLEYPLCRTPRDIKIGNMTAVAQAMPDKYKHSDPIVAYRRYCIHEKTYAKWEKGRDKPEWWTT